MTDKIDPFVHLHSHIDSGSLLDGFSTVAEVVAEVKRLGQPGIAVTDHGSLASLYFLYEEAKKNDIIGIAGCEFYVVPSIGNIDSKEPLYLGPGGRDDVSASGAYTHMTILAENNIGLRNLFHLTEVANVRGFYKKPRISLELLEEYHEGLIVTTGCPSGEIQTEIRLGHFDKAVAYASRLVDIMGKDNVFVELMDHGMIQELERKVRGSLLEIARLLGLKLVATNDLHYARHDDAPSHEEMLAIQTGAKMSELPDYEGGSRFAFEGNGSYYVKSAAEMLEIFPEDMFPGAVKNTLLIAERSSFEVGYDDSLRPAVPIPDGYTEDSWLRKESFDGLRHRLPDLADNQEYIDRLEKELRVLKSKGFSGYFLVVSDFIRWAKFRADPAIPMGPGRGCLSADTNVLTPLGFKRIPDVKVGDEVYNQYGKVEKVTEVFEYDCDEDLLEIKGFFGVNGNKMTTDHKVLVSKANRTANKSKLAQGYKYEKGVLDPQWIRADEIEIGDLVVTPKTQRPVLVDGFKIEAVSITATNLKGDNSVRSIARELDVSRSAVMKFFSADGNNVGPVAERLRVHFSEKDLTVAGLKETRLLTSVSKSYVEANAELGEIIGIFLSDGWIRQNRDTEVGFAQRASEDTGHIPNLFKKVFGLDLKPYLHKTSDLVQYTVNHKGVRNFFAQLVKNYEFTAGTKELDERLLFTSEEFRRGLLSGLWYGDGSHKGKSTYTTVSSKLAEGVHQLLLSLGLPAGINRNRRVESRPEYNHSGRDFYYEYKVTTAHNFDIATMNNSGVGYDGEYTYYRVREINKVASEGKVYDFTMPETHSYLTDSFVVHNSAAGSLIAYALDITDADPIRHDLLFERFLNEERDSPPDIDIDVSDLDRGRLIQYVIEAYGEEQVALVLTYGRIGAKQALKDVIRIYEQPFEFGNRLSKAMPPPIFGKEIKLKDIYNPDAARYPEAGEFRALVENEGLQDVVASALKLEGRVRSHGTHAAAVIISTKPLVDYFPIGKSQKLNMLQTQWDYHTAEELGLIKMDFLGLRNLGIIAEAVANVKKTQGIEIDVPTLTQGPMDDPKVYEILQKGDTLGVFQLDGGGMRGLLRVLKPTGFEDISAVLSLYRPGPMGVGAHMDYALRKNGLQAITPIHEEFAETLKDVLEPTYGTIIYQEQVQRIAQIVASYSLAEADLLRRAMGKKKREIIDAEFATFRPRAIANGYSEVAIQMLWDILVPFADYAFNKCLGGDTKINLSYDSEPLVETTLSDLYKNWEEKRRNLLQVIAYDSKKNTFFLDDILDIHSNGSKLVFEMKLENGKSIRSTADHRHLTSTGMKELTKIRLGDSVASFDGDLDFATVQKTTIIYSTVVSIREIGFEETYDLEVNAGEHNYVANGIVTHNSHTVAYGITSYVTAYLKANFPAEYMSALLSSVSNNTDKTAEYLEDCRQHGIKVTPPDINKSVLNYAPVSPKEIAFGFVAIKGMGSAVGSAIVDFREREGKFTSFHDFLNRAPKEIMNKKVVQALALGGAFDNIPASETDEAPMSRVAIYDGIVDILAEMQKSRTRASAAEKRLIKARETWETTSQTLERAVEDALLNYDEAVGDLKDGEDAGLPAAKIRSLSSKINAAQKKVDMAQLKKQKAYDATLQSTLDVEDVIYKIANMDEWSKLEKLKLERTVLGLYVSGHPMDDLDMSGLASNKIADLVPEYEETIVDGETVRTMIPPAVIPLQGWPGRNDKPLSIAGIVTQLTLRRTKAGKSMAVGTIEDKTGSMPFTVFPKTFVGDEEKGIPGFGSLLKLDGVYQFTGYSRENDEEVSFNVDTLRPLEFSSSGALAVRVKLTQSQYDRGADLLNALFARHSKVKGKRTSVILSLKDANGRVVEETLKTEVTPSPLLLSEIRETFGPYAIGRWRQL